MSNENETQTSAEVTSPISDKVLTIRIPRADWAQIVSDIENMCGCAQAEIEILQSAELVDTHALRRQVAEQIAAKCLRRAQLAERVPEGERSGVREGMVLTWLEAERLAREIAAR